MSVTGFNRRRREAARKAHPGPQAKLKTEPQSEPEKPVEPPAEDAESDKSKRGRPRKTQE
ncbi:hypothetical protein AWR38_01045 [Idiomarina sp. WRN-38]|nr:hypothetical protein AUR68_01040 [Idiomarina sp. H105]OAE96013.1 hypothetical protein AWR38_01045 [Idiomarina sp. WRN-38]